MHDEVSAFYQAHPYPPAVDDLVVYRRSWDEARRRADSFLFWPAEPYRDDRSILVAGCGTNQAAHYAVRWPNARVVGIDVSKNSIAHELELKQKHGLDNLEIRQLPIERAGDLGETFDHVACTGVLHHLADPNAGLHALHDVLAPNGVLNLMVYAPYGRAGIYMIQEYCRRLHLGTTDADIRDLSEALRALPPDHPLVPLLRNSPDFASPAGLADALLHPRDRSYSVSQFFELLGDADLQFGRWIRQALYLPECGAPAATPHRAKLSALPLRERYAAVELFRGTMVRHSAIAYRNDRATRAAIDFEGDAWPAYVPTRLPGTLVVRERLPAGSAAVLINRNHAYTDLFLPIDSRQLRMFEAIDGERTIGEIGDDHALARTFFLQLWHWDQVVFGI
jgi:SAM-dependent methyltransferase